MTKSLALLITLIVLVFGALGFGEYWSKHHIETEYARKAHQDLLHEVRLAQADGISLDRNSLKSPPLPPAENAGPVYDEITAEIKAYPLSSSALSAVDAVKSHYPPTATELSQARIMLQQHTMLLSLIHKATGKKKCVLRVNWDAKDPTFIGYPQLSGMRAAARVIEAESIVMAQDGRVQEAVQNQALGFRIADHLASGKTMIFALVGDAVNAITLNGMRKILYLHGDDPAVAKLVMEAIHQNCHTPNVTSALRAEATMQYAGIDYDRTLDPKDIMPAPRNSNDGQWKIPSAPYSKDQQNAYLDATEADVLHRQRMDILASEHPYPEANRLLLTNAAEWSKLGDTRTELAVSDDNDFPRFVATGWRDQASALIVETSARLLIWKSEHGSFPSTLSALAPRLPIHLAASRSDTGAKARALFFTA